MRFMPPKFDHGFGGFLSTARFQMDFDEGFFPSNFLEIWKMMQTIWKSNYRGQRRISGKPRVGPSNSATILIGHQGILLWMPYSAFATTPLTNIIVLLDRYSCWIVMMISPTPGSSGTAEFFFAQFFTQFLVALTPLLPVSFGDCSSLFRTWFRAVFLPRWIKTGLFQKKKKKKFQPLDARLSYCRSLVKNHGGS